jgi:leucyl/phenylalanyl-tRNA--protein transferase
VSRLPIPCLGPDPAEPFPPARRALADPNGLLAFGGDLSPTRLLNAYRAGVFPWYSRGQPILWWSPDPRVVFRTAAVRLSSRLRRDLRRSRWTLRADTAFDRVVAACATTPRPGQDGTWITREMACAYGELHRLGHAHSVEVFADDALVGGIYGVAIGRMFFGESMFSAASGGSKVALAGLARTLGAWDWPWIDGQVENPHLMSLGAECVPRPAFLEEIGRLVALPGRVGRWTEDFGEQPVAGLG